MGKDSEGGTEVDDVQVERRKEQDIVNEIHSEGGTEVNDQDSVSNNIVDLRSEGGEDINEVQEEGGEGEGGGNEIHSEGGTEVNDQDSVSNNIVDLRSEGGEDINEVQEEGGEGEGGGNEIHSEGGTEVNDQDSVSNNIVDLRSEGGEDINEVQEEGGEGEGGGWSCIQCTLLNRAGHLACSACGETRFPNDTAGDIGNRSGGGEDDVNENGSVRGGEDEDIDSILNPIYIQGSTQQRPKISLDQANVRLFEELGNCIFCTGAIDNGKPFVQCSCSCKMFYHKGCFGRHLAAGMPFCPTCRADLRK